jgi:nicotinamidase/pyrazinamidase
MENGRIVHGLPSLSEISKFCQSRLALLPEEHKRFDNPHIYKVGISEKLRDERNQLKINSRNRMNALILVDIQNDFMPGGPLAVPLGDEIISLVNELQNSFGLVVATQDWHPRNHKSFASNHKGKSNFDTITLHGLQQVLWPDHCIQGSAGAQIHPGVDLKKVEGIFRKGMDTEIDSYSAFYDNGYKKSTGLAGYFRERKIKKVYVCGLAADYCVYYTAKDSLKENFETYIIEDATRAIDRNGFVNAKENILANGGQIIRSEALHRHL